MEVPHGRQRTGMLLISVCYCQLEYLMLLGQVMKQGSQIYSELFPNNKIAALEFSTFRVSFKIYISVWFPLITNV
jgi:hypothetical protein